MNFELDENTKSQNKVKTFIHERHGKVVLTKPSSTPGL
jgi:hypothetical protein